MRPLRMSLGKVNGGDAEIFAVVAMGQPAGIALNAGSKGMLGYDHHKRRRKVLFMVGFIDVWGQVPTERMAQSALFEPLRRWTGSAPEDQKVSIETTPYFVCKKMKIW